MDKQDQLKDLTQAHSNLTNEQLWELWKKEVLVPMEQKYKDGLDRKESFGMQDKLNFDIFEEKFMLMAEMNQRVFSKLISQDKLLEQIDTLNQMLQDYPNVNDIPIAIRITIEEIYGQRFLL